MDKNVTLVVCQTFQMELRMLPTVDDLQVRSLLSC
jgi:hypothetical protein